MRHAHGVGRLVAHLGAAVDQTLRKAIATNSEKLFQLWFPTGYVEAAPWFANAGSEATGKTLSEAMYSAPPAATLPGCTGPARLAPPKTSVADALHNFGSLLQFWEVHASLCL